MKKLFLSALLLACMCQVKAQSAASFDLTFEPHTFKSSEGQEVQAELGTFYVRENRSVAGSRKIKLAFIRFKCTGSRPGSPIVYLAGGPGGAGTFTAKGSRFGVFMAMREFGDVIAFDQRGTGMSEQLETCAPGQYLDFSKPGNQDDMIRVVRENFKNCISFWKQKGIDPTAYNNNESADDIDDLRKALGAAKITLWGISYGTQLAFSYVKRHEAQTDKLILAALEATGDNIKRPSYADHMIENAETALKADLAASAFPPLRELMRSVLDKLEKNPASVVIKDRKGADITVGISKFDVQLITSFFLLKNPSDLRRLPLFYQKMKNDDYRDIAQMVFDLKSYGSSSRFYGMGLLMDAMTGVSAEQMKLVNQEVPASLVGRATNFPFPDIAEGSGLPDLGDEYRQDVKSNVPGLFLSGTLDGRTFMEDATRIAGKFRNVRDVIVVNGGHDLFEQSPKVQELIVDYMRSKSIPTEIQLDHVQFATK